MSKSDAIGARPTGRASSFTCWPTLEQEALLWGLGYGRVAGVDEAGRGAWAGPVVAAAVVLPADPDLARRLDGLQDSKLMSVAARQRLYERIRTLAAGIGVGVVPSVLVDSAGLAAAGQLALCRAVGALPTPADYLLVDHFRLRAVAAPQLAITRGDARCLTIAAAAVVAKVTRDQLMTRLHERYPAYAFDRHKGYGTAVHQGALAALGPCAEHRRSYRPVRALCPS